jgi:hypothetical protein
VPDRRKTFRTTSVLQNPSSNLFRLKTVFRIMSLFQHVNKIAGLSGANNQNEPDPSDSGQADRQIANNASNLISFKIASQE